MMREPFTKHSGLAASLMIDNIDTDQIIPSREMKTVGRAGLGEGLFAGWRYMAPGTREKDSLFILNQAGYRKATLLISGFNFGCGSSREHATWALAEYGIRVIIAKSFGEIFYGNCTRNGILPIKLNAPEVDKLAADSMRNSQGNFDVDLVGQTVSSGGETYGFEIGAFAKRLLVEGLDPIGLTLQDKDAIAAFQTADKARRPWVYSAA